MVIDFRAVNESFSPAMSCLPAPVGWLPGRRSQEYPQFELVDTSALVSPLPDTLLDSGQ